MKNVTIETRISNLNTLLKEQGAEFTIQTSIVYKDGAMREAVTLKNEAVNIAPTVYLTEEDAKLTDSELVAKLMQIYAQSRVTKDVDVNSFVNRDFILANVLPRFRRIEELDMIEKNTDLLFCHACDVDLLVTYYFPVNGFAPGALGTIAVTKKLAEAAGLAFLDIANAADYNAEREMKVVPMREMMLELLGDDAELAAELIPEGELPFYVLTNENKVQGAGLLASEPVRKKLYDRFGKYFVIPSSIHEVLIIPAKDAPVDPDALRNMIEDVNDTQVPEEERLSYHPFFYDGTKLKICD